MLAVATPSAMKILKFAPLCRSSLRLCLQHALTNVSTIAVAIAWCTQAPMCGNAAAKTSLAAIGNRLRYPKGEFPAWVLDLDVSGLRTHPHLHSPI